MRTISHTGGFYCEANVNWQEVSLSQDFKYLLCDNIVAAFTQVAAYVNKHILFWKGSQQSNRIEKYRCILVSISKLAEFIIERFNGSAIFFG
jgi:hypothetical protein